MITSRGADQLLLTCTSPDGAVFAASCVSLQMFQLLHDKYKAPLELKNYAPLLNNNNNNATTTPNAVVHYTPIVYKLLKNLSEATAEKREKQCMEIEQVLTKVLEKGVRFDDAPLPPPIPVQSVGKMDDDNKSNKLDNFPNIARLIVDEHLYNLFEQQGYVQPKTFKQFVPLTPTSKKLVRDFIVSLFKNLFFLFL